MDFKFNRQTSKDFLFKKSESLKTSFSSGASGMKNGLFGGFSQVQSKLDQISTKINKSLDLDEEHDSEYTRERDRLLSEQERQQQERQRVQQQQSIGNTTQNQSDQSEPVPTKSVKQKPPKPPLPKQLSRGSIDQNGSVPSSAEDLDPSHHTRRKIPAPSEQELNFNEPLFDEKEGPKYVQVNNQRAGVQNPFTDITSEATTVFAEIHNLHERAKNEDTPETQPRVPDLMQRRRTNPFIDVYDNGDTIEQSTPSYIAPSTNASSKFNADLLPGIPRVPSHNNADLLNPTSQSTNGDLLAITPTSGAALPIPTIDPTPASKARNMDEAQEIYDDSDADSVATEGCDEEIQNPEYDEMEEVNILRSGSGASDMSWSSNDSHMDQKSRECMEFMRDYTIKIFDTRLNISPLDKSRFGHMCQQEAGRLWFARYINAQKVTNQKVKEHSFFQLVQYFAILLFECNEHEDYKPAKTLMNLCFTFYHEADHPTGPSYKHFLYSYLKDQPIWQSLKFWNAAYFDAIMVERCKPVPKEATASGDDREYQQNITFSQLATFLSHMKSFGLAKELCMEFLRKQSVVANLTNEQIRLLKESIERPLAPNGAVK